jgi:hypothetical protein
LAAILITFCLVHFAADKRAVAKNKTLYQPSAIALGESTTQAGDGSEQRWFRSSGNERTAKTEEETMAALEEMARLHPDDAMALALRERNPILQEKLRDAVLRSWASVNPDQAAAWVMQLEPRDRPTAISAVFQGAARQPTKAVQLGAELCAKNPTQAFVFGQMLITSLAEKGAFEAAANFASADISEYKTSWINSAYYQWATYQPDKAMASLAQLAEPSDRHAGFEGIIAGWAFSNPESLATYALECPSGEIQRDVLNQALPQWAIRDPAAALAWISARDPGPDYDAGIVSVATLPALVRTRPETAIACAAEISEPTLRVSTLRALAQSWAENDISSATRFVMSMKNMPVEDCRALAEGVGLGN